MDRISSGDDLCGGYAATAADPLASFAAAPAPLASWSLRGHQLIPIVQGGMGVAVSAGGLAGAVASFNGIGTISAVDLRRLHPDLMAQTEHLKGDEARDAINAANLVALDREIARARGLSKGRGRVAVNVMRAVSEYESYVQQALQSGIDAVVVGAGLPLDLPDLAKEYPDVALIPILSDSRGVQLIIRKWEKKGRLPDAIVIEHPRLAGGHLGAAKVADLGDRRFDFDVVIPEVLEFMHKAGLGNRIPLVAAGGISSNDDIRKLQKLGASAAQLGTAFAVTQECDADIEFKKVLAGATPEDIVEFTSVAGLPARAVRTPWLDKYLRVLPKLQGVAHVKDHCNMFFDCLAQCGLRDGKAEWGQFCIDKVLGHAASGDTRKGLFFRGAGRLPFGTEIRPVRDLIAWLMGTPQAAWAA
jgi:nitronate monooxygenase